MDKAAAVRANELRRSRVDKRDESRRQRLAVVISSAESALKTAFLVNGGGAVALLAFFGQMAKQNTPAAAWVAQALLWLVIGTALAAFATGLSFLAQYGYMMGRRRSKLGRLARDLTAANVAMVMCSYTCFVVAGAMAFIGLR